MRRSAWSAITATRPRRVVVTLASLMMLALGVTLILLSLRGPTPPDPATAEGPALTAFLADERFTQLSSRQREAFCRGLADRYLAMDQDQRDAFEASWAEHRQSAQMARQIEAQMTLGLIRRITEQYADTPIDQREMFLDGILFMLQATDQSLIGREFHVWADGNPLQRATNDPRKMARGISDYKGTMLDGTNASERADITRFAGDLLARSRQAR